MQGGISSERHCTTQPCERRRRNRKRLNTRQRRIARRLEHDQGDVRDEPVMSGSNIDYEVSDRAQATAAGGIGAIHRVVRHVGLMESPLSRCSAITARQAAASRRRR